MADDYAPIPPSPINPTGVPGNPPTSKEVLLIDTGSTDYAARINPPPPAVKGSLGYPPPSNVVLLTGTGSTGNPPPSAEGALIDIESTDYASPINPPPPAVQGPQGYPPPSKEVPSEAQGRPERSVTKQLPPLPPELEKQKKDVLEDLYNAVRICLKHYRDYNKDHNIKKFFDTFKTFIDPKPDVSNAAESKSSFRTPKVSGREGSTVRIHTVTTGNTYGADKALLAQMKDCGGLTLEEIDMSRCHVIILFCPIKSRPGSDVEYAMSDLPGDKPVILVLMHHSRKAYYADTEKWSETYPKVILGVNVFYHETVKGLLSCPENKDAVEEIKKKLLENHQNKTYNKKCSTQPVSSEF